MILACTSKGCFKPDEHLLDEETNEVICIHCGNTLAVPQTTKRNLRDMRQVRRKPPKALAFKCASCGELDRPVLKALSGGSTAAICRACGAPIEIPGPFLEALKLTAESESDADDGARPL